MWNNDPLMVAGGAMVGIDPVTGKMLGRDSDGAVPVDDDEVGPDGLPVKPSPLGGKWAWKEGVDPFLGPDVPENPMGRQAGPWLPPPGADVSMYRPDFRQVISDASEWIPDVPVPKAPTVPGYTSAADRARGEINAAFTTYGADPSKYSKNIEDKLAAIIAGIPANTTDYNTFFPADLGSKLIGDLETGYRNKLEADFESLVPKTFFKPTTDDAAIDKILADDRVEADNFIKNMLARGQITDTGAEAARIDLDRQAGLGRTKLSEIGTGLIGTEESELGAERSKRKGNIGSLKFTDPYDTATQKSDLDKLASDFIGTLGEGLRAGLGGKAIYSTTGLPGVASKAGGTTQAGAPEDEDEDTDQNQAGSQLLF